MLEFSQNPEGLTALQNRYPQGGIERSILETMSQSGEKYSYDTPEQLGFELEMRSAIVKAALDLARSGIDFAVFRKSRCNEDYWKRTENGGFMLKDGVKPSEAIRDIFQNGTKYATECATAIVIIFYRAVLEVFSDDLFNKTFPRIYLMNWHNLDPIFKSIGLTEHVDEYLPGDRMYFINPDVDPSVPEWQGENVIMLGPDRYYGHGVGIQNGASIIKELNENRSKDADEPAYLMKRVGRLNFRKLYNIRQKSLRTNQ